MGHMGKTEQSTFSSVLSINPYKEVYFSGVSSFITETTSPEFKKDQFTLSYLNTNDFITSQIAISKNIPEEDLYDAINAKMYDDLGLDNAVEYKLQYVESFDNLDEDNRYFHVFIVDPLTLDETFKQVIEKIKYLDVIIPTPLLIRSLYTKEIIESSAPHCFIYFQENDAFVTIYRNQEFVYTKSLKFSFLEMHERFCELYGERVDYESFMHFLTQENLKDTQSDYKEYFIKLYKELFANINDILTYTKRAFEIEKFEHIYIGLQAQTQLQLDEMLEAELNIKSSPFLFDYGFEYNGDAIDQLQALMHLYTTLGDDEKYLCNFTTYYRPPRFIERQSGKFILLIAASFIIAFAYPVTYWVLNAAQELQKEKLQDEYQELHIQRITREATIKHKRADKQKSLALLKIEQDEYTKKKNTLTQIHKVKVEYPMKAKLLTQFSKDLNKYGVHIGSVNYHESDGKQQFVFQLITTKDRSVTKLVEHLTQEYENKFTFSLHEIGYDSDVKHYLTELKAEIL